MARCLDVPSRLHGICMAKPPYKQAVKLSVSDGFSGWQAERVAGKNVFWWGIGSSLGLLPTLKMLRERSAL